MKIIIVGFGSMGRMVAQAAESMQVKVVASIDPHVEEASNTRLLDSLLAQADVVLDFSTANSVIENIKSYLSVGVPALIGTTGWSEDVEKVKALITEHNGKLLVAGNFSIGVAIYSEVVRMAARFFSSAPEYDVWGYEVHHFNKADSPSGTAKVVGQVLLEELPNKSKLVYERLERKIASDEIHFASVRGGPVNFEHTVEFGSSADTITIKHTAKNRMGYAHGAIQAARWLLTQPNGFYDFQSFVESLLRRA